MYWRTTGCLRLWLKFCAVFTLVAFFLKGPIMRGEEEYAKRQARTAEAEKATTLTKAKIPTPAKRR